MRRRRRRARSILLGELLSMRSTRRESPLVGNAIYRNSGAISARSSRTNYVAGRDFARRLMEPRKNGREERRERNAQGAPESPRCRGDPDEYRPRNINSSFCTGLKLCELLPRLRIFGRRPSPASFRPQTYRFGKGSLYRRPAFKKRKPDGAAIWLVRLVARE